MKRDEVGSAHPHDEFGRTDAPAQIVRLAQSSGFTAIAITDHDTLGGLNEALSEGARVGLRVIPGCEISSGGVSEVHVLAMD